MPDVRRDDAGQDPDDTAYSQMLRPGIRLSNGGPDQEEWLTTSGVPVKGRDGEKYVTVSAHGFPGPAASKEVWHPNRKSGKKIGTMIKVLAGTDIGLMRLESGSRYATVLFSHPEFGAPALTSLKPVKEVKVHDVLSLDSPFSGRCDGYAIAIQWARLPDGTQNASGGHWIHSVWTEFDEGTREMMNGTCGSAIFDEEKRVVAFYNLAGEDGHAYAIAAGSYRLVYSSVVIKPCRAATSLENQGAP